MSPKRNLIALSIPARWCSHMSQLMPDSAQDAAASSPRPKDDDAFGCADFFNSPATASPADSGILEATDQPISERTDLILSFARILQVNGQSTHETLVAAARLSRYLNLRSTIIPSWGVLQLQTTNGPTRVVSLTEAAPTGVNMARVASAMGAMDNAASGELPPREMIKAIANAPAAPAWLFSIAAAAGAVALSVIFGAKHLAAVALIAASSGAGAVLRRFISRHNANQYLPPLCAALLAGVVGALAARNQLSSVLRLVAVCPCMILVPGPHVLNGMMDLAAVRVHLGAARLIYAGLVVLAISGGLLLGLGLLRVSLPVGGP